jgi:hypothetical protein
MPMRLSNCSRCKEQIIGNGYNSQLKSVDDFLEESHFNQLCKKCTAHFESLTLLAQNQKFPTKPADYIQDVHYYLENNFWVFTELYHFLRGTCCGSGCRHCAYGFTKNKRHEASI